MSAATKRKFVTRETEDVLEPEEHEMIVKILASRGNNLHEVQSSTKEVFLFRRNVWIKRGDFVLCQPIEEGDKVKAEICHILGKENVEYLKKQDLWPKGLDNEEEDEGERRDKCNKVEAYDIDEDMFPPSSSEEEESEDEEAEVEQPNEDSKDN